MKLTPPPHTHTKDNITLLKNINNSLYDCAESKSSPNRVNHRLPKTTNAKTTEGQ